MFFSYVLVLYYVYIMVLQYYFICAYICVDMYLFLFELSNYTFILVKYLLIWSTLNVLWEAFTDMALVEKH